ncbi:MAG: hypothetical protein J7M19_01360 [Planctomycetes bacterium]|nr:hypothetical protein [Planctomycetota bacterium]
MLRRVLLVGDRRRVPAEVLEALAGCEVHIARTQAAAQSEMDQSAYDTVICRPSAVDSEFLQEIVGRETPVAVWLVTPKAAGGASGNRESLFCRPKGLAVADAQGLEKVLHPVPGGTAGFRAAPLEADISKLLLSLTAGGAACARGREAVEALVDSGGAVYAGFVVPGRHGDHPVFAAGDPEVAGDLSLEGLRNSGSPGRVEKTTQGETVRMSVGTGRGALVAVFPAADRDAQDAFKDYGPDVASFLARCSSNLSAGQRACLLLEAVRSIMHDTRNGLTGLSLAVGGWLKDFQPGSGPSDAVSALMMRSLGSIELLCREFAGVETAIRFETTDSDGGRVAAWYTDSLARFGLDVEPARVDPSFRLPVRARGLLARALVQLAWALYKLHATSIAVSSIGSDATAAVAIVFESAFSPKAIAANQAVEQAAEFIESGGGSLDVERCGKRTEIKITFAVRPAFSVEGVV